MKICLVAEGCYPYIVGGVSSWIHQLILNMPEHEFIILAINPDHSKKGQYKYTLPSNLIEINDIFMDELLEEKGKWNKKMNLSGEEMVALKQLLTANQVDWTVIFKLFQKKEIKKMKATEILMSKEFYQLIQDAYGDKYTHVPFTQVYWTLRSMYVILFALLKNKYPVADVYHSVSTGYAGLIGAYAAYEHRKPFMMTEHGIYTREREEEIIKSDWVEGYFKDIWIHYFYSLSQCAYTQATQVITLFNKNKEIQVELGCSREIIKVIHNGIAVENFEDIGQAVARREMTQGINVGAIIRVVPIKDIKTMLQAFSIANKQLKQVTYYIMGPTDEDEEYSAECMKYKEYLNLDNVIFTGKVDIRDYLKKMDFLVLTSISEGQPLALLEGMVCKLPFITTNVGDCKALIYGENDDYGPAGRVVPIMDYNSIAEGIVELAQNETLRKQYGEAGYNRVKNFYSFKAFIDAYKELYQMMK